MYSAATTICGTAKAASPTAAAIDPYPAITRRTKP
jgi:hypothetical protein